MSAIDKTKRAVRSLVEWVKPDLPGLEPLTVQAARMLTERNRFSELINIRDFDTERNIVFTDDAGELNTGFMLAVTPLIVAGLDAESGFEAIINTMPTDAVLQFIALSTPQVEGYLNVWANSRLGTTNEILRQIAVRRRQYMLATRTNISMLPATRLHPRMQQWLVCCKLPFKGDIMDSIQREQHIKSTVDIRNTVQGTLKSMFIESDVVNEYTMKVVFKEILSPHIDPTERLDSIGKETPLLLDLMDKRTRISAGEDGYVNFAGKVGKPEVSVVPITVDAYPRSWALPGMAKTLGDPVAWDERITCPYMAYTTVHVLDADKSRDEMVTKLGALSKQTMSESPWFRSMMGHLYERKQMVEEAIAETRKGHRLVRAYSGINLYCDPSEAKQTCEYAKGLWRKVGFRVSEEKFISLPVFTASLPFQYSPLMDPPNKGLQRAQKMTSLNAAGLIQISGDWRGTPPSGGGPLLTTRRGQMASFDIRNHTTNGNFVTIASSGSGKSFLQNEMVADFLSKKGQVRIIDVGRSYHRLSTIMGGQNIVFQADNPVSLNPFSDVHTQEDLNEMMPMIKDLLRQMAFPLTPEERTDAWQYAAIEKAIQGAWTKYGSNTELLNVCQELEAMEDPKNRGRDVAMQLEPYAVGRYKKWFSGPRSVSFDNPLCVIELEELKQDPNLQATVLTIIMYQVAKEMYLSDRAIPKLLTVDEAYDLLGGLKTGKFIEILFRRARKYGGCVGVITQSFADFGNSPAARAAMDNAEWQFILYQKPESIEYAVNNRLIVADSTTVDMIRSVKSGPGFSEVYVRNNVGSGLYRFITDKHSYYTYTSNPRDIAKLEQLQRNGMTLAQAIDKCAQDEYTKSWGSDFVEKMSKY